MVTWAKRAVGFTLIEIAIVLVVVGILLSGALVGIRPVLESSKTATTNSKLERIELALLAYVMQNGCLPCPADGSVATANANAGWSRSDVDFYGPNGPANRPCTGSTGTACNANFSVVPWNTLGLREADIVDGWNSRISYAVDPDLTLTAGASMTRTLPATYPIGSLAVTDFAAATPQTTSAAYVLVSHGKDRTFAYAATSGIQVANTAGYVLANPQGANSPSLNATGATAFRQDTPRFLEGAATYFDDVVRYRTAANIIRDCGPGACGNPS